MRKLLVIVFFVVLFWQDIKCVKHPKKWAQKSPASKYANPGQVRDRMRHLEAKEYEKAKAKGGEHVGVHRPSVMGDKWSNRYRQPFHPAWMDYCDPYHCNDYHKTACGLNRDNMKFKWFQSGCHIAINNICTTYKGTLKYDMIDPKYCTQYVMHLRSNCPQSCGNEVVPVCGISSYDNHVVLFKSMCHLEKANCQQTTFNEYEPGHMDICRYTYAIEKLKRG